MPTTFPDWLQDLPDLGVPGMRLRALREDDAVNWYAYLRQEVVIRHTSWCLEGPGELAGLIQAYARPGRSHSMRLAIAGPDDRLAGTIGLNEIALTHRRAEIAYDIAPEYWRQGLATKACAVVSDWALQTLGFARIQATVLDQRGFGGRAGALPLSARRAAACVSRRARRAAALLDVCADLAASHRGRGVRLTGARAGCGSAGFGGRLAAIGLPGNP